MEFRNISFSYNKITDNLKGINGKIEKGKITTIIGPNGSGKSTLLGVLSRNYLPSKGEVILDGKAIQQYKPKEFAQKIAVVHQHNDAPSDITIERLVSFGRLPHKGFFHFLQEEDEQAIQWALTCTNLQEKRTKRLSELSGGERQRVWVALSLVQKTPILFLDEPTTYLDIYYQLEMLELIKSLNVTHGLTIVMVLHEINQAIRYSDQILVMKEGEVVMEGTPNEVITEKMMKSIYGVDVVVKEDPLAGLYVLPIGV